MKAHSVATKTHPDCIHSVTWSLGAREVIKFAAICPLLSCVFLLFSLCINRREGVSAFYP